jgi:hypothetical protein
MRCSVTPDMVTELKPNEVFVFGSNAQGKHGAGAAKAALQWGAVMGEGFGLHGQTYAIDTMSGLEAMPEQLEGLWRYASTNPEKLFLVTALGCGIAGHKPEEIASIHAVKKLSWLDNVSLPQSFIDVLTKDNNND